MGDNDTDCTTLFFTIIQTSENIWLCLCDMNLTIAHNKYLKRKFLSLNGLYVSNSKFYSHFKVLGGPKDKDYKKSGPWNWLYNFVCYCHISKS